MSAEQTINTVLYSKIKQNDNTILNMVMITISMSIVSYIIRQLTFYIEDNFDFKKLMNFEFFFHKLHKKNSVEYEGKISCAVNTYSSELKQTSVFGKRFKALWEYIISEIDKNPSIHSIKEQTLNKKEDEIYMVNQKDKFLVCKELEIYAYTYTESDTTNKDEEENKTRNKTSNIIIELYS